MRIIFLGLFLSLATLANETQYAVKGGLKRGEKATTVHIELETFNSARVNAEAPISLELISVEGAQLPRTKFSRSDFLPLNNNTHRLEIESKGLTRKINAHLIFYLCFKNTCKKIDYHFSMNA